MTNLGPNEKILSIDIGGSRIKATILDREGNMLMEYSKKDTPPSGDPEEILQAIAELTSSFQSFSKVSVGFPGYVRDGVVYTAPNLSTLKWKGINLRSRLTELLKQPVKVVNDADMQGLGVASGRGLELVVTLGTGFGTALLMNGNLLPHLEIAHHPVFQDKDYDEYIGERALEAVGVEEWNQRVKRVIDILKTVFNYDHLYIGGGNSKKLNFKIDPSITLVNNVDGIKGGVKLWLSDSH